MYRDSDTEEGADEFYAIDGTLATAPHIET